MHGLSGAPIPDDRRLALVRDAERGDVARPHAGPPARLAEHAERDAPDLLRVVLHPSRARVVLAELGVSTADDASLPVEEEDGGPGRALMDRTDDGHQGKP